MFYPSDRETLEELVSSFISGSGRQADEFITGIVSPHAGYVYSGAVAGAAFASAPDDIRNVIVIAPPHRCPVTGASVYDGEGYETPLGTAPVQREITSRFLVRFS
jgi:AmmeMemoRadiSam system protein B